MNSGTFTDIVVTILVKFVLSKYSRIREMKAQNLLWVQFFPFLCCSIFTYFEEFLILLHKKSNLAFFFAFMWKIVIMCWKRFHFSNKVKNDSFDFQYFLNWGTLANIKYCGGEKFLQIQNLFLRLHLFLPIRRYSA